VAQYKPQVSVGGMLDKQFWIQCWEKKLSIKKVRRREKMRKRKKVCRIKKVRRRKTMHKKKNKESEKNKKV
jgi:hypothetical protein